LFTDIITHDTGEKTSINIKTVSQKLSKPFFIDHRLS
jgi:hypothetical protein